MHKRLDHFLALNDCSVRDHLRRAIQDPLRPTTVEGRVRINSIVLILGLMILLATSTFLVFSFGHR